MSKECYECVVLRRALELMSERLAQLSSSATPEAIVEGYIKASLMDSLGYDARKEG